MPILGLLGCGSSAKPAALTAASTADPAQVEHLMDLVANSQRQGTYAAIANQARSESLTHFGQRLLAQTTNAPTSINGLKVKGIRDQLASGQRFANDLQQIQKQFKNADAFASQGLIAHNQVSRSDIERMLEHTSASIKDGQVYAAPGQVALPELTPSDLLQDFNTIIIINALDSAAHAAPSLQLSGGLAGVLGPTILDTAIAAGLNGQAGSSAATADQYNAQAQQDANSAHRLYAQATVQANKAYDPPTAACTQDLVDKGLQDSWNDAKKHIFTCTIDLTTKKGTWVLKS